MRKCREEWRIFFLNGFFSCGSVDLTESYGHYRLYRAAGNPGIWDFSRGRTLHPLFFLENLLEDITYFLMFDKTHRLIVSLILSLLDTITIL
jgi:hypothetical protein